MAEEEKDEQTQDETEEAPQSEEQEAPAAEEEPTAGPDAAAGEAEEAGGDEEVDWKARRRLERSRESGPAGQQRSPEARAAERAERRLGAAKARRGHRGSRRRRREAGTGTPPADRRSVARKIRQGTVVSNRADKTITVRIDTARRHPSYEKIVRRSNTLRAHDERNEANEGDLVRVVETRPLSRSKRWRLTEILERAK
jgi:small subunit ribosomal protein S17